MPVSSRGSGSRSVDSRPVEVELADYTPQGASSSSSSAPGRGETLQRSGGDAHLSSASARGRGQGLQRSGGETHLGSANAGRAPIPQVSLVGRSVSERSQVDKYASERSQAPSGICGWMNWKWRRQRRIEAMLRSPSELTFDTGPAITGNQGSPIEQLRQAIQRVEILEMPKGGIQVVAKLNECLRELEEIVDLGPSAKRPAARCSPEDRADFEFLCDGGGTLLRVEACVATDRIESAVGNDWFVGRLFVSDKGLLYTGKEGNNDSSFLETGLLPWDSIVALKMTAGRASEVTLSAQALPGDLVLQFGTSVGAWLEDTLKHFQNPLGGALPPSPSSYWQAREASPTSPTGRERSQTRADLEEAEPFHDELRQIKGGEPVEGGFQGRVNLADVQRILEEHGVSSAYLMMRRQNQAQELDNVPEDVDDDLSPTRSVRLNEESESERLTVKAVIDCALKIVPGGTSPWLESWCTPQTARVFLEARRWDPAKASIILAEALHWRADHKDILQGTQVPRWQGDLRVLTRGTSGHPIVFCSLKDMPTVDPQDWTNHIVAVLEASVRSMANGANTFDVVADMSGFKMRAFSSLRARLMGGLVDALQVGYRGRMRKAMFVDTPKAFRVTWSLVAPLLKDITRDKYDFVTLNQATEYLTASAGEEAATCVVTTIEATRNGTVAPPQLPSEVPATCSHFDITSEVGTESWSSAEI